MTDFPMNTAGLSLTNALLKGHEIFKARTIDTNGECRILFVVEIKERNEVDQRLLETLIFETGEVVVDRLTLAEIDSVVELDGSSCLINRHSGVIYSVVYFRSGYSPEQYACNEDACWNARKKIEVSTAVKSPSVLTQLAGTKKVQQLLSSDLALTRFGIIDASQRRQLMAVFALQVDPSKEKHLVAEAVAHPDRFVLKPQREGGGNNLYKEAVREALLTLSDEALAGYVLMERMLPESRPAVAVSGGRGVLDVTHLEHAVCELGIFSVFIPDVLSESKGHMVRTKDRSVDEGGVNSGFAFLDTVRLID
jgi:glutathione synthase